MVLSQGWHLMIPLTGLWFVKGWNAHSEANAVNQCFVLDMLSDLITAFPQSPCSQRFSVTPVPYFYEHTHTSQLTCNLPVLTVTWLPSPQTLSGDHLDPLHLKANDRTQFKDIKGGNGVVSIVPSLWLGLTKWHELVLLFDCINLCLAKQVAQLYLQTLTVSRRIMVICEVEVACT